MNKGKFNFRRNKVIFVLLVVLIGIFIVMLLTMNKSNSTNAISEHGKAPIPGKLVRKEDKIHVEKLNSLEDIKNPNSFRALKGRAKRRIDRMLHHDKAIPILMYHYIHYNPDNEMCISKEKFSEQMVFLKNNGFTTLSLDELYSHLYNNADIPDKPIVITFDDGYADNYENAYPVLRELGFKATIFDITSTIDKNDKFINSEQIKEMDRNGIAIEAHTVSHPRLNKYSYEEQFFELNNSKKTLENILGREIKYLAYPYGDYNTDTLVALKELGYKMAVTTFWGRVQKSDGFYNLPRYAISNKDDIDNFRKMVEDKKKK